MGPARAWWPTGTAAVVNEKRRMSLFTAAYLATFRTRAILDGNLQPAMEARRASFGILVGLAMVALGVGIALVMERSGSTSDQLWTLNGVASVAATALVAAWFLRGGMGRSDALPTADVWARIVRAVALAAAIGVLVMSAYMALDHVAGDVRDQEPWMATSDVFGHAENLGVATFFLLMPVIFLSPIPRPGWMVWASVRSVVIAVLAVVHVVHLTAPIERAHPDAWFFGLVAACFFIGSLPLRTLTAWFRSRGLRPRNDATNDVSESVTEPNASIPE